MFRIRRLLLAAAAMLAALPAHSTFHLWSMDEVYSNSDGSVQFLEMTALTSFQQFFTGHTLKATQGGVTHTFVTASDLPGDSAGHTMIFATQGFAALGIVTPDYIVPNGFFFTNGGTIVWGEGADTWTYGNLPIDGSLSLHRDGSTAVNSPRDFAGTTGTVSLTANTPTNYTALWWNPAESGWGINVNHQGDILFATLFTYDSSGKGMWLVMSDGAKQAGSDTYTGDLYLTNGPAFNAQPFTPITAANLTKVGTMTLAFSAPGAGTLTYTVNGTSVTKAIEKQVYGAQAATCQPTTSARSTLANYQDLWWNPSESGWGINITHQGDILFATLFTYSNDGTGHDLWLVMSAGVKQADGSYLGDLYQTTGPAFNAQPFTPIGAANLTTVGTMRLTFSNGENGTLVYSVNGNSVTKAITRQVFSSPVPACTG
jgi:hypothetical protein